MTRPVPEDRGSIAFAEKFLQVLDEGAFTATYKYAVLLGLMDLCLTNATRSGAPPESVTTAQLADSVIAMYWPHAAPYIGNHGGIVLRQNTGGQAEIVSVIRRFRDRHAPDPSATMARARGDAPVRFAQLLRSIEWKLVEMPLPRAQLVGEKIEPFIYRINWDTSILRQQFDHSDFDNRILFVDGAADHLVRLSGLLRPLVQRNWAAMVARLNRESTDEPRLEEFLFGISRLPLNALRSPLRELQGNRCFYCGLPIRGAADVDHFLPWARYPDNGIENLVAAHPACNNQKRDFIAAAEHVGNWVDRFRAASETARQLTSIASTAEWERHAERTLSVARAIYLRLPSDARLWRLRREFVPVDRPAVVRYLSLA